MEYLIASLLAASTVNVSSLGPGLWNFDLLVSSFHCPAQGSAAAFLPWANARDHPSKSPNRTNFFVMIYLPAPDFLSRNPLHVSGGRACCQDCSISIWGLLLQVRGEPDFRIRHYGDVPRESLIALRGHDDRMFSRRELQVDWSVAHEVAIDRYLSMLRRRRKNYRAQRRPARGGCGSGGQRGFRRHGFGWRDGYARFLRFDGRFLLDLPSQLFFYLVKEFIDHAVPGSECRFTIFCLHVADQRGAVFFLRLN